MTLERYVLGKKFGRGVLELQFEIVEFGDHFERLLSRFYKVELEGKAAGQERVGAESEGERAISEGPRPAIR